MIQSRRTLQVHFIGYIGQMIILKSYIFAEELGS